ncbi:zinc-binding alcohol dehydrogenase [Flagellimonas lutimaris]|uniref:Zinc-binding alcohol dehydrogenase n=1 Tax=Flagellimonas lutimaris TaxID=475082 RepID=A0A3A1N5J9_9FLAO|nr:zinc-binding alcohol dehydrogenase [Allomuricauda lutimaris]RIV32472.1 zinc-binding alcohol dehydrogenase [Allomuricauda lutimaris]
MKVKEIPVSLFHQANLTWQSKKKLTSNKKRVPVIVSLASIPSRLNIVHLTVRSLFNQDVLPEKIVLWLHEDLKGKIPKKLNDLVGELFMIEFTDYFSSHRKLVEPLNHYPEKTIITCDDDMMYRKNWLSKLYEVHQKHPNKIIANQTRCITYNEKGELLPYKSWKPNRLGCENSRMTLPIGAGGTLYPPNTMDKRVFDRDLFLKLAPNADDLWFKIMGLLKGTTSIQAYNSDKEPIPIWGSQKQSLKSTNIKEDKNRTQWSALTDHFQLKFKNID